jgi:hypothetical protein
LANISGQRKALDSLAFASHSKLARAPVDVVQIQRAYLARAQAEANEQHQHCEVSSAAAGASVTGRQQALYLVRL